MESVVLMPKRLKKTRLAELIPVILGCVASQYAIAQLTPGPPPIESYAGIRAWPAIRPAGALRSSSATTA